jgi:TRAP-type C4-dicarboxylate transport system substrate-binding protein
MNFGTALITYSIGETKWRSLPENVRKVLTQVGEQTTREGCKRFEDGEKTAAAKVQGQGMTVINFSDVDKKELANAFAGVADTWAKDTDKRGKPGSEVLKVFTAAVAESK